jgi:Spy/CpxP family protein refolding chaperone
MKCWTWFLSAALLAVVAVAPILAADAPATAPAAPAAPAPAAAAPAKPPVEGDLAVMVRECKLTDEQVAKLSEAANAIMVQLNEWQKTNADKLAGFQKAYEAARTANDEAAMTKVRTDAQPVMQERMTMVMKGQKGMMDILTPDQRAIWVGFITFRQLMVGMAAIDLTAEQLTKIREICNASGKSIDGIKDEGEAGMAAMMKARIALLTDVREKVLSAEQRAKLPPITEPPVAAPKAPAADSKAPAADSKAPAK